MILSLAHELLESAARAAGVATPVLTTEAITTIGAHAWPGNVRELRLVLERAVLLSGGQPIGARHVLLNPRRAELPPPKPLSPAEERAKFVEVATRLLGNASAIARELSTSRTQVRRLAERYALDLEALRT
jgi:DNA-binding NtrC family response regulator